MRAGKIEAVEHERRRRLFVRDAIAGPNSISSPRAAGRF
jgi:hypothetical protein